MPVRHLATDGAVGNVTSFWIEVEVECVMDGSTKEEVFNGSDMEAFRTSEWWTGFHVSVIQEKQTAAAN